MHPNPTFRKPGTARNIAFARDRGFGMLAINADPAPLVSHIPFLIDETGTEIELHLVRSNPILKHLRSSAVIAVQGPDGYVSPDWYEIDDQVPTWNYVAVHLRGTLRLLPDEALRPHLEALSDNFEARLAPKPIWKLGKVANEPLNRMLRMIAPVEMTVESVEGTWKLNQNKDDAVRLRAADEVGAGAGLELNALAALMRDPPG